MGHQNERDQGQCEQCYPFYDLHYPGKHASFPYILYTSVLLAQVTTSSTDFSFHHLVFWNLFEFSAAEIT
jgi:hypothetical protein